MSDPSPAAFPTASKSERSWDESGAQRLERQLFFALLGGMLLLVAWLGRFAFDFDRQVADIAAMIGALILVIPLARGAAREVLAGRPSSDALASLAVLAAIAVGEYLAAGFLAFFLWLAELILSRTAWGAQRAIRELVELTPDLARVINKDGEEVETSLANVAKGAIVRVRPGENLPVDGRQKRNRRPPAIAVEGKRPGLFQRKNLVGATPSRGRGREGFAPGDLDEHRFTSEVRS